MSVTTAEIGDGPSDERLRALRERNMQKEAAFAARMEAVRKQLELMNQDSQALAKDEQQLAKQFGEEQNADPSETTGATFAANVAAGVLEGAEDRHK